MNTDKHRSIFSICVYPCSSVAKNWKVTELGTRSIIFFDSMIREASNFATDFRSVTRIQNIKSVKVRVNPWLKNKMTLQY